MTIRAYANADAAEVHELVASGIDRSPYQSAPRSAIDALTTGSDPDARALVAVAGARLTGVILFGGIAGSEGAGRIQLIVVDQLERRRGIATMLVEAAMQRLHRDGARFALVELPDDAALAGSRVLLERCSFQVESRVRDFFRDGIDLMLLRRDLAVG